MYLVCGVAVPNNEFAILGGADQKPEEKNEHNWKEDQTLSPKERLLSVWISQTQPGQQSY